MKMVKPVILAIGAIPVILALLIVIPMLTSVDIPTSAINPSDKIQIEFTKHDLRIVSFGVTDKTIADNTHVLTIENDGTVQYTEISDGVNKSQITSSNSKEQLQKLSAMIKETGFMSIPKESFPSRMTLKAIPNLPLKLH